MSSTGARSGVKLEFDGDVAIMRMVQGENRFDPDFLDALEKALDDVIRLVKCFCYLPLHTRTRTTGHTQAYTRVDYLVNHRTDGKLQKSHRHPRDRRRMQNRKKQFKSGGPNIQNTRKRLGSKFFYTCYIINLEKRGGYGHRPPPLHRFLRTALGMPPIFQVVCVEECHTKTPNGTTMHPNANM